MLTHIFSKKKKKVCEMAGIALPSLVINSDFWNNSGFCCVLLLLQIRNGFLYIGKIGSEYFLIKYHLVIVKDQ